VDSLQRTSSLHAAIGTLTPPDGTGITRLTDGPRANATYKIGSIRRASELVLIMDGTQVTNPYNTNTAAGSLEAAPPLPPTRSTSQLDAGPRMASVSPPISTPPAQRCQWYRQPGATSKFPTAAASFRPNVDCQGDHSPPPTVKSAGVNGQQGRNFLFVDGTAKAPIQSPTHCDLCEKCERRTIN